MEIKEVIKDDRYLGALHFRTVPNLPSQDKSIIRKWCSFKIKSKLRMNKQSKLTFERFIAFFTHAWQAWKKQVTSWHRHSCRWAEWALFWGVGVFRSSAIQERAVNKSYDKRGNYIPSLPSTCTVVISSTEKGLVVSHWSVTNQTVLALVRAMFSKP